MNTKSFFKMPIPTFAFTFSTLAFTVLFLSASFLTSLNISLNTPLGLSISTLNKSHAAEAINDKELKEALTKLLKDNPEIIFTVLQENSDELIKTITVASEKARASKLEGAWKQDLKTPKNINTKNNPSLGKNNANNIIIGYSDFLCSYCAQAANTIHALINKRDDATFTFKSTPKSDASRIATHWFYHINKKDSKKAWQFHDSIFASQQALAKNPIMVVKEIAKKLGFDADAMEKDITKNQKELDAIIRTDMEEATKMGFSGTPYFVVNNVVLRGSHPLQTFEDAIEITNKNK